MRLIDADALKGKIYEEWFSGYPADIFVGYIEDAPTIDPVKHGKWFNTSTDIPKLSMNVCSECGFQYPSAIRPRFNYCPNCGARMELEDETD